MQNISNPLTSGNPAIALTFVPGQSDERTRPSTALLSPGAILRKELATGTAWENFVWMCLAVSGLAALVISLWW